MTRKGVSRRFWESHVDKISDEYLKKYAPGDFLMLELKI